MRHRPKSLAHLAALSLIVLGSSGGCAYYNTFYIAKKNFREAQKAQEKNLTDAPAVDAVAKYEIVIRQCNKMMKEHPNSKWSDDAGYLHGAALYGKGDYAGAIKRLEEFRARYPESPFRPEARFTEGLARYKRKEYEQADSVFREILSKYPQFPRKWELYHYAGETQSALRRYDAANWWFQRALKEADGRRQKGNTLRRSADAYLAADRPDTAQAVYDQVLQVEERGVPRVEVAMDRAEALRRAGHPQEALDFLQDWRAYAAQVGKEGELMLRVYDLMALSGRVPEAIQGYRGLVEKFPRTAVAYESQFQIGFLHETALGDLDGAGREYDKLRTQPGSEFQVQAARRSQNLATMKQYRSAMASDTTQAAAKAAFLLAELYYFQLEKPDSAILLYRNVERDHPASVFAPKSAYARLWIAAHDRQDTLAAMALADTMAERYRGTRYAESALYLWKQWSGREDERTTLLDSLLAHPDTSRYAEFEPETELNLPAVDSTAIAMRAGFQRTAQDSAKIDSLRQRRLEALAKLRGEPPPSRSAVQAGPAQPQTADSSRSGSGAVPVGPPMEPHAAPQGTGTADPESGTPEEEPQAQPPTIGPTAQEEDQEEEDLQDQEDGAGS